MTQEQHYWVGNCLPNKDYSNTQFVVYSLAFGELRNKVLCYKANSDKELPDPFVSYSMIVSTKKKESVTCQDCLEYIHA